MTGDAKKREPDNRTTSKKGCVEIRSLWLSYRAADIIREQFEIPDCHSVIRLDKEVRRRGERTLKEIRERFRETPAAVLQ